MLNSFASFKQSDIDPRKIKVENRLPICISTEENQSNFRRNSLKRYSINNQDHLSNNSLSILARKSINLKKAIDRYSSSRSSHRLSGSALNQLYTQCITLLRQNKINTKNAFDIRLIEHLGDIVSSEISEDLKHRDFLIDKNCKDSESGKDHLYMENLNNTYLEDTDNIEFDAFQRAAVTLEASARIYGYRVDSTYDNACRILSEIKKGNISYESEQDKKDEQDLDIDKICEKYDTLKDYNSKNKCLGRANKLSDYKTIVSNKDLITLNGYERHKVVIEKGYFVKKMELGAPCSSLAPLGGSSDLGVISSLLMSNIELENNHNYIDDSISLSYNISGLDSTTSDKRDNIQKQEIIAVDMVTLTGLLSVDDCFNFVQSSSSNCYRFSICSEVKSLVHLIKQIKAGLNDICNDPFPAHNALIQSNDTADILSDLSEIEHSDNDLNNSSYSDFPISNGNSTAISDNVEKISKIITRDDSSHSSIYEILQTDYNSDNNYAEQVPNIREVSCSHQENNIILLNLKSEDVLNYFTQNLMQIKMNHLKAPLYLNNDNSIKAIDITSKKGTKKSPFHRPRQKMFKYMNIIDFDGISWIKSLIKPSNSIKMNNTAANEKFSKIFIDRNHTTSTFIYNVQHLTCLSNLVGRYIQPIPPLTLQVQNHLTNDNSTSFMISEQKSYTDFPIQHHIDNVDFIDIHDDFINIKQDNGEDIISIDETINNSSISSRKVILSYPALIKTLNYKTNNNLSQAITLVEPSTFNKNTHNKIINQVITGIKSSNYVNVVKVKSALNTSIQEKGEDLINFQDILNTMDKSSLSIEDSSNLSVAICFISMLHLCNENNYCFQILDESTTNPCNRKVFVSQFGSVETHL
ncbi:hypothetical protein cand_028310 [Cryptosporidium andersoni]|uniref:Condensin complex subunit 2 n=1 Tax=Cryptosporidium andersoni TaxID=117008 RepID=A0A1J4MQW9_9CRYT|nr:hypothetical protein cand_028310 [Cryptosporidium andersoni]